MRAAKSRESVANEIRIQNAIAAYNTRRYCTIGKAARAFEIPYSTMKDPPIWSIFTGSSTRNSAESIKRGRKDFSTMDYTSHNHWIPGLSQAGVGNGRRNSSRTCVLRTSSFARTIRIAPSRPQLAYTFQTAQSWDLRYMDQTNNKLSIQSGHPTGYTAIV